MDEQTTPDDVLEFWYGPEGTEFGACSDIWWGTVDDGEALDREIREKFSDALERAAQGDLDDWLESPRGRLAYIIVVDQFSRNIHRGRAEAFANDDLARRATLEGIERGHDRELPPKCRLFFYMPLMHAEDFELQNRAVELFRQLADETDDDQVREVVEGTVDHALEHRELIERFSRFPHRNPVLGREMTDDELAYLEETGNWYGQKPDDGSTD